MVATALTFRMGAGYPGALNRAHPATVLPYQNDPTIPVPLFGQAVAVNAAKNGVRGVQAADAAATFFGIAVRPFPFQQGQSNSDFAPASLGVAGPLNGMAVDVMKAGLIMVQLPAAQNPGLGDPVFVWTAASAGVHVQGGIEATNPGGSGYQITTGVSTAYFNGGPDASGIAEIAVNP